MIVDYNQNSIGPVEPIKLRICKVISALDSIKALTNGGIDYHFNEKTLLSSPFGGQPNFVILFSQREFPAHQLQCTVDEALALVLGWDAFGFNLANEQQFRDKTCENLLR